MRASPGLSGLEQLDIYVNGFSVLCEAELQLEDRLRPQLLRYSLAPLSCVIRNVVIRVSRCSEEGLDSDPSRFGVVVSKSFGVLVGGRDLWRARAHCMAVYGPDGLTRWGMP